MNSETKIGVILGPTAVGKSAVAVYASEMLNAEIVSADSIQVYKEFNIGSAKPPATEMHRIPHHLIDCIDPDASDFSVAEYKKLASKHIDDIAARGRLPLVVGGTGLYINALIYPLDFTSVPPNAELRSRLAHIECENPGALHKTLSGIDPVSAERLHKNDIKRLIRAIEVYEISGKPLSEHGKGFAQSENNGTAYNSVIVGLTMPRDMLYRRIEKRVDIMMTQGLECETRELLNKGYSTELPAFAALGYKQLAKYITDPTCAITVEAVTDEIKRETRRFAKRQLTWFRRDKRIHWIDVSEYDNIEQVAKRAAEIIKSEVSNNETTECSG